MSVVFALVALRKESVDRNSWAGAGAAPQIGSLSARRAWIEMSIQRYMMYRAASLSARRAWIEISFAPQAGTIVTVALRKESVDRNAAWTGVLRDMHHVALRKESVDRNRAWAVKRSRRKR